MSTLKTGTVQNNTGTGAPLFKNNSGTEIGQLAKAWINFNGTGTVAIRDSFNVTSLTDEDTGRYTVNFTNAFPDTNYCPLHFNNATTTQNYSSFNNAWGGGMTLATTYLQVSSYAASSWADSAQFFVVVFEA